MNIPFSLPVIGQEVINEMLDTLTNTGWLTSGPKVLALEQEIKKYTETEAVVCVNSWTSGAMLMLRWFGIGPGDEVIIPAYTYSATALAVLNIGAKPIMVDVGYDFNINVKAIGAAITSHTKAIIPVDMAGLPVDYDAIFELVNSESHKNLFDASNERQKMLGRILVLADAAHSFGAIYNNQPIGNAADITIFSLHSVKNITTGEGGAICLNLPAPFQMDDEYRFLKAFSLNGQTKSALEKNQAGAWKYDIIDQGLKVNMPDLCATVGLAQIRKYKETLLPERKRIFDFYNSRLSLHEWAITPFTINNQKETSYHLYLLRIREFEEEQRDQMIKYISEEQVGVNVHYIPMPMLTLFNRIGYKIEDFPITFDLYKNEITLPVYNGLTLEQLDFVIETVVKSYYKVLSN